MNNQPCWTFVESQDSPEGPLHLHVPHLEQLLSKQGYAKSTIRGCVMTETILNSAPHKHKRWSTSRDFDVLFTKDKPFIFGFHGYPWWIHRLTYRRNNHPHLHVRGYKEEGTTPPFDMSAQSRRL